jgi:hypothetical protein
LLVKRMTGSFSESLVWVGNKFISFIFYLCSALLHHCACEHSLFMEYMCDFKTSFSVILLTL